MINSVSRVVFDTNIIVSGIIKPDSFIGKTLDQLVSNKFQLIISNYILEEATRILVNKCWLDAKFVHEHLVILTSAAIVVEPLVVLIPELNDNNDWPIIGTALAGSTELLVTGDKELLKLKDYKNIQIITPRVFLDNFL